MLSMYVPAVLNYRREYDLGRDTEANLIYMSLSENYKFVCEKDIAACADNEIVYNKLRLVIDQISGMTDTRAMKVYRAISAT